MFGCSFVILGIIYENQNILIILYGLQSAAAKDNSSVMLFFGTRDSQGLPVSNSICQ